MSGIRMLRSSSHEPHFNLAVENTIFQNLNQDHQILFLWRNAETVVIGKGQNPWKECNTGRMELDGVTLARRQSGGGAVFHDLGNTNFTFMGKKPSFNKSVSTQIVLSALNRLGIVAKASGRNDLVIETEQGDRKFSGSAYRERPELGFHHGTLLLNTDLSRLANYLNPDPKKLTAKGIASVRSRVMNLCEILPQIDHDLVCDAIESEFMNHHGQTAELEIISPTQMPELPGFEAAYESQQNWNWNFGKSLDFSHVFDERFVWGGIEIHLDVHRGNVRSAKVYTDSLQPDILVEVVDQWIDVRYDGELLSALVEKAARNHIAFSSELSEFAAWTKQALI